MYDVGDGLLKYRTHDHHQSHLENLKDSFYSWAWNELSWSPTRKDCRKGVDIVFKRYMHGRGMVYVKSVGRWYKR